MSILYDLLDVTWGDELLRARPVRWDKDLEDIDPEEDDVCVTAYELVCPSCGNRCEFETLDLEILCEGCESKTSNPIHISEEPEEDPEPIDVTDDLVEDIEKAKEDLKSDKPSTPEDILDSLSASIANTEIILEEPNENDKKEVKESKQSTKKKTKKTKKKTKKK